jgi:hypothetical protein
MMIGAKYACPPSRLLLVAPLLALTVACSGQKQAEQIKVATDSVTRLQEGVVEFATSQQRWPSKIDELKVGGDPLPGVTYGVSEGGMISVWFREGSALPGATLHYTPKQDAIGSVTWSCKTEALEAALKPANCA